MYVFKSEKIMILPIIKESFKIGNRGEAFLEFIMSKYCLMHKVVGYKDIGIDYICEWLSGGTPSRILFGIQVKTSESKDIELIYKGVKSGFNELAFYNIKKFSWSIEEKTIEYWSGFEIPLFLFCVIRNSEDQFNCYYSRLTPILHRETKEGIKGKLEEIKKGEFYQANENSEFRDIVKKKNMDGGFVRDLFIDSVRCSYQNGSILYRNPKDFGLNNWPEKVIYPDVLDEENTDYMKKVKEGLLLLEGVGLIKVDPNFENKIKKLKERVAGRS